MGNKTKLWVMTLEEAEKFFQDCLMKEAVKKEEREQLADNIVDPVIIDATPEEVIKEISKQKKTLYIHKKDKIND